MCAPAFRALDSAAATACFSGCPEARISRMFWDIVARELPGLRGMWLNYTTFPHRPIQEAWFLELFPPKLLGSRGNSRFSGYLIDTAKVLKASAPCDAQSWTGALRSVPPGASGAQ